MKMSPATRMMVMSDRYKKSSNGERQQDGRHQMEQPRYNEDYVGRKARERQGMRHGGDDPMEMSGSDPYSSRGMMGYGHERRHYDDDDDEYGGKPQRMYAAGMAWTDGHEKNHKKEHKEVDEECAMKWVREMKAADNSQMPHFRPDLAEQMRKAHCPDCKPWEWFTAINMMYADYIEVAKKLGVNRDECYALMAKAFLMDEDAGPNKLSKYMEEIPKK